MKKINLVSVNSKFIHSSLAVLSISKMYEVYAEKFCAPLPELTVTETTINDSFDSIVYSVMNGADVYAFSVYIWNVNIIERLCKHIKTAQPDSIIILGGPEVSYGTPIEKCCDYIISGEGERAFFALICELNSIAIPNEWDYKADGKIRIAKSVADLSEIEFPYNEENIENYNGRIIYYESSRGCPFSCAYCLSSVCGKVRELPLERVISDLNFFIEHKVPQVKFVDRTFNCNRKRAQAIWRYIIEAENCETNFHFEIGADLLSFDDLEILKKSPSGRIQFEAGIQSTFEPALDECCRHTDTEKLFSNVRRLVDFGNINIHVDLIAGLPYEILDVFKKSFNDAYALNAHQLQLGFLKLLHGAPLNGMIEKHGYAFSEYSPYEIIFNKYLTYDDIVKLKCIEDVLERFYNSNRFRKSLKKIEKYFENPFEMFEFFAKEIKKRQLTFRAVSTKVLYDFLSEIFAEKIENMDRILLFDFYTSEKSELVPSRLRYLGNTKEKLSSFGKVPKNGNKKAQIKFIGNDAYLIDYSKRNPVDGCFEISEVVENVYL
ncbi:MAG: DUF4080 domain-containing protein [Clostridia bacterium]|nr:DUF4080 domain-containing protein [Clostridia bacterium]